MHDRSNILLMALANILLVVLWSGEFTAPAGAVASWHRLPDMPVGVFNAAASCIDDRAIVTGGLNSHGRTTRYVQVLDLTRRRWKRSIMLPEGRCLHVQVALSDGRILIAGGRRGTKPQRQRSLRSALLLDPIGGRIEPLPPLASDAAQPTGHLLADARAIVIGGHHASVFDPHTGRWVSRIALRHFRQAHASVVLDEDRILVVGGTSRASIELIELHRAQSRLLAARLPDALDDLAVVALDGGRALILGGQTGRRGNTTQKTWVVEFGSVERERLLPGPSLGVKGGIADHCVVVQGRRAFVVGGESQQNGRDHELAEARVVDLHRLTVSRLPATRQPHDDAVAVSDGQSIIVFGGYRVKQGVLRVFAVPVASKTVERLTFDFDAADDD